MHKKTKTDNMLKHHGFFDHPFRTWISEDEKKLEEWFIPPPFLDTLLYGSGCKEERYKAASNVILGEIGSGKTATRKMMEKYLIKNLPNSLVLRYVDFTRVLTSENDRPTIQKHVDEILLLGTVGLIGFWCAEKDRYSNLRSRERSELAGLAFQYYDNLPEQTKRIYTYNLPMRGRITKLGDTVLDLYNASVQILKKEKISPSNWKTPNNSDPDFENPHERLQRFWHLSKAMGIDSIWVMVDSIDESAGLKSDVKIFNCIADLLLSQRVLEFRENEKQVICFKVFMKGPGKLKGMLKEEGYRPDRVQWDTIQWNNKDLNAAFQKRLAFFSNNNINIFDQLCVDKAKGVHNTIVKYSRKSPRLLFLIANKIFAEYQKNSSNESNKIDIYSIKRGIRYACDCVNGLIN